MRTSHSLNPVELFYISNTIDSEVKLLDGVLSDIGVTVLDLLGLDVPGEMDAKCLISKEKA